MKMEQTYGTKREKETLRSSHRYLTGRVVGALVLACFSVFWGLQSGLNIMLVIVPVVAVVLIVLGLMTMRAVRRLPPEELMPEERAKYRQNIRRFWMVVIIEFTAAVAAVLLFRFVDHPEYIGPTIGLIVGLHFLPLASFFQVRVYTFLGVATSLLAGVAILAQLSGWMIGGLVVSGVAVVFWLTSLFNLLRVRQALSLRAASSQP